MTVSPNSVVTRVVEYEPPLRARQAPAREPSSGDPGSVASPVTRLRHLHAVPDPGRASPRLQAAAAFTDAALRTVLEVIDQRRPGKQLRPLMIGGLADTVLSLSRIQANNRRATGVLRRVRLQAVDPREDAFEVTATYTRAPRVHALACRVELVQTLRGVRWQLTALHIG